jgi:hypothetical protein
MLDEPTDPVFDYLEQQCKTNSSYAAALARWLTQRSDANYAASAEYREVMAQEDTAPPAARITAEQALAEQLGLEIISLREAFIDLAVAMLIPAETSLRLKALPVRLHGNVVILAMVDPLDIAGIDEVRKLIDRDVEPRIASEEDFAWAHGQIFGTPLGEEESSA